MSRITKARLGLAADLAPGVVVTLIGLALMIAAIYGWVWS